MQELPIIQKTYDLIKWYVHRPTNAARHVQRRKRYSSSLRSRRKHKAWGVSPRMDGEESLARENGRQRVDSKLFRTCGFACHR